MSKTVQHDKLLDYMTDGIKYVCQNFKRRAPGTQSERDAQDFFKKELEKYSDEVISEDFELHPHAFMGFIPVAAIFVLIAIAFYWIALFKTGTAPIVLRSVSIVILMFSMFMFLYEFMMYREFVDFLFPKRVSRNVYATRKPSGEVKRRIIFGGHADAAYEWTYSLHGGLAVLLPVIVGSIGGMFISIIFNLSSLIASFCGADVSFHGVWKVFAIIELIFIPIAFAIIFFINWSVIVDGANDNLTACYISMAVLKDMADNDFRFENTEVGCLISGSEEAGLRGAAAFAKRHKKEMLDVETVFISLDTMKEIEQLMVYTTGCTGTVHDCEAVGDLLHDAGKEMGVEMPRAGLYPGAVDAEAFSRCGIRSAGFCGVNHDPKKYYHTREDSWDNIDPDCIDLSFKICKKTAEIYDQKGGISEYEKKYQK
ncbi:MAG: M28 family peptidase [Clostridiales bacterium]|nr:M28 family peptidase [Clostridiales bacterium]